MLGDDVLGVDDAVLGVLGAGDDVLGVPGGGKALLPFFLVKRKSTPSMPM